MRILVTGSRNWNKPWQVTLALSDFLTDKCGVIPSVDGLEGVTLVHGACPTGADAQADRVGSEWAEAYGLTVERHPAEWDKYGRMAGPIRNQEMVNLGADVCLAFLRNGSRGTAHTIRIARLAGIPIIKYYAD